MSSCVRGVLVNMMMFWPVTATADQVNDKANIMIPSQISFLGEAWAANTINTVIFRHYGLISNVLSFVALICAGWWTPQAQNSESHLVTQPSCELQPSTM